MRLVSSDRWTHCPTAGSSDRGSTAAFPPNHNDIDKTWKAERPKLVDGRLKACVFRNFCKHATFVGISHA